MSNKAKRLGEKYAVQIWFWTGNMNTYLHKDVDGLNKEQAESLFRSIQADGIVTEVHLIRNSNECLMSNYDDEEGIIIW